MSELTSASSPVSEDSTSPLSGSGSGVSDRLSGTQFAPESSNDGGPMSRDGVPLLPTPSANQYEHQDAETIRVRREREAERHRNGNGFGLTTAMALTLLQADSPANPQAPQAGARAVRTPAGSGPSSPVLLASWDPDTSSWRTYQASLLSIQDERFPRSWETWPRSGMTRDGRVFALPTLVPLTDESGSSSLLHSPTTGDTGPNYVRAKPVPNLHAQVSELLPTPTRRDYKGERENYEPGPLLPEAIGPLSRGAPTNPPSEDGSE
jgi:hypothetical protein